MQIADIIKRFETKGFKLVGIKVSPDDATILHAVCVSLNSFVCLMA